MENQASVQDTMKRILLLLIPLAIAIGKLEAGQPANDPWIYTCCDHGTLDSLGHYWVYTDYRGVPHFFPDIQDRCNRYTGEHQTLIDDRWVSTIGMRYW